VREVSKINSLNEENYKGTMTSFEEAFNETRLHDDSFHQLEDGHPATLRDLDDANEHHLIGGDIAMSYHPLRVLDRTMLAILKTV